MSGFRQFVHMVAEDIRLARFRNEWREANPHNSTVPQNRFPIGMVSVGDYTYGPLRVVYGNTDNNMSIGSFCSIGPNVTFVVGDEHPLDRMSTFPFDVMALGGGEPEAIGRGGSLSETTSGSATGLPFSTGSPSVGEQSSRQAPWLLAACRPMRSLAECRLASSGSASTTGPSNGS